MLSAVDNFPTKVLLKHIHIQAFVNEIQCENSYDGMDFSKLVINTNQRQKIYEILPTFQIFITRTSRIKQALFIKY